MKNVMMILALFSALAIPAKSAHAFKAPIAIVEALAPQAAHADTAVAAAQSDASIIGDIAGYVAKFPAADSMTKVMLGILALIALFKTSFLRSIWDKAGAGKVFIPLGLALIAGIIQLKMSTGHLVLKDVLAYMTAAGGGAILLHQLLDGVKAIPGLGSTWVMLIDVIGKFLGQPAATLESNKPAA